MHPVACAGLDPPRSPSAGWLGLRARGGEEIIDKEKKEFNRATEKILRRSSTRLEFKQQAEHRISLPHDAARRWPARCLDARGNGFQRGHDAGDIVRQEAGRDSEGGEARGDHHRVPP